MAITLDGTNGITSSGVITGPDGSASAPAITNDGDTNTGIFFPAADTIAFGEGGAEVARFDSSGRLGIGLTSLSSSLDIAQGNGQIRLREGGATKWAMIESSNGRLFLHSDQGNTEANSDMRFYVDNTEYARITSVGEFLIGKTDLSDDVVGIKLGNGNGDRTFTVGNLAWGIMINRQTNDGTLMQFRQANTDEGSISVSGTTVSYNGGHLSRWAQMLTKPSLS